MNVLSILTNENHFPKTMSMKVYQWEFNYGLFTNLPRIISFAIFLRVHSNSKEVSYLPWQSTHPNFPANISTLIQRCILVVQHRDVRQCEINVETTLCISTLEFTTSNKVESTLCISTLIWTTPDNVEITFSFSTLSFTMLVNVKTTLWKWPFLKRTTKKRLFQTEYTEFKLLTTTS